MKRIHPVIVLLVIVLAFAAGVRTLRWRTSSSLERCMPAVHFRVISPFDVIQPCLDGPPFVTVPLGAIIETQEEVRSVGLAEIRWNNQPLLARMRDIEEYTKPLDESACA